MANSRHQGIIADFLRHRTHDGKGLSDQAVIDEFGGDTANEIVAEFENDTYLYISIDSNTKVASVINLHDLNESHSAELCNDSLSLS